MKNIDAILARIQHHFNAKTRKEMMQKWDIPYASYKAWVNRRSIPKQRLIELAEREGLHLEWILTGEGEKYANKEFPAPQLLTPQISKELARIREAISDYSKDKRTAKIAKTFDALDEEEKEQAYREIMPIILKYL